MKVGDRMMVCGVVCEVFKVHVFGTVDMVCYAWRVSGLVS